MADGVGGPVDVLVELEGRDGGVPAVDRDERVGDRAQALGAPPLTLLVGRDADRAADVRGVAGTGLRLVSLVPRAEHDHRLAVGRGDDVARVRRDPRAFRERPEVQRLEVRERRVLALDVHHGLVRRRDLPVEQRPDRELAPGRLPERGELARDLVDLSRDRLVRGPVERRQREPGGVQAPLGREVPLEELERSRAIAIPARADMEDGERLVGADDHGVGMLLEDLHRDAVAAAVSLEDELRAREVDVALVAGADLLDRKAKDIRSEPFGDDHGGAAPRRIRTCS